MSCRRIFSHLILNVVLFLTACTPPVYRETEKNIAETKTDLSQQRMRYENPVLPRQIITANGITLGNIHVQPLWLNKQISVRGRNLPFEMFVNKILNNTSGIAVYETGINQATQITLNYSGTIRGALEAVAAKANYAYDLNGNTLLWSSFVSKTFDISFMPGASQYLLGRKQGGGGQGGAGGGTAVARGFTDTSQYSSLQGSLSIWNDLKRTVDSMKSKDGQVIVSEATTTITVRDHPENVRLIGNYLASMDKNMSQQVALDIQVLEVSLNKSFNYGIDWNVARNFMGGKLGVNLGGSAPGVTGGAAQPFNLTALGNNSATLGIGIMASSGLWAGTSLFINAIAQQGKVSVSTRPRVITLNNQVAEIGINRQTTYLAQTTLTQTVAAGGAGNSVTLTPGVVSSGFSVYLLPKIQGNNVYLQITSTLSNLERMDKFDAPSNQGSIQMPVVAEKRFNQRSVLPSGSTLILAGFKQLGNRANEVKMFESAALGGKGGSQDDTETIVLITPTIIRVNS